MSESTRTSTESANLDEIFDTLAGFSVDELVKMSHDFSQNGHTIGDIKGFKREELEAIYNVAYNAYNSGRYDHATKAFQFLCYFDHLMQKNWMGLGASRQMQKDYANAVEAYTFAYLLDPDDPLPPLHAADCQIALGKRDAAISGLTVAIEHAGDQEKYQPVRARAEALLELLHQSEHNDAGA